MANLKNPFINISDAFSSFSLLYGEKQEGQKERYEKAFSKFKSTFNVDCAYVASSSGRCEVIGNHTDHNGGKVISSAISLDTLSMFLPRDDGKIHIVSDGYKDMELDAFGDTFCYKGTSLALVKGVIEGIKNLGLNVGGFNAYCTSNVLGGAGISSSAAFELLIAEILNFLYNDGKITEEQKAKIAQFSEREYFGKPCGLLDQTAISFGGLNVLDFKPEKISVKKINDTLKDYAFVLVNTGGSHAGLTNEYAAVPNEMFEVANAMGVNRLIDIDFETFKSKLPSVINKLSDRAVLRAYHFYEENERVEKAYNAINNKDYETFIDCLNKSGESSLNKLQNCFVAGRKDQSIPKALSICGSYLYGGANRVHGGGFAGSILNVVKKDKLNDFLSGVYAFYDRESVVCFELRSVGTIVL